MPAPPGASNSTVSPDDLAERIQALSAEFASSLKTQVNDIRSIWTDMPREKGMAAAAPEITQIHDIAHSLAGAGKSLGFPRISQTAAPLDSLFRLLKEKQTPLTAEEVDQIDLLISDLEEAVDIPGETITLGDLHASYEIASHRSAFHVLVYGQLDSKSEAINDLTDIGYKILPVGDTAPPVDLSTGVPAVLLSTLGQIAAAQTWLKQYGLSDDVPIVAVGEHGAFTERLEAVRQGATDFMHRPLEREDVFNRMSAIEDRLMAPPLRVVFAEDDPTLGQFYQLTLESDSTLYI